MAPRHLRVATRGSALARWQADHVAELLRRAAEDTGDVLTVETVVVETHGDRDLTSPIATLGGKGVFVKEVQAALLDGRADLAVHSAKDLPARTPDGLVLAAVPERADARDALVGRRLDQLAPGATVATGSARRRVQLAHLRPDLTFTELRGNMATRLGRVPDGGAVVAALAALDRLGWTDRVAEVLDPAVVVPQVGQGALAVECRADDEATRALLARIEHASSRVAVDAERGFLDELGGDCDLPAGAHATFAVPAGADATVVPAAVELRAVLASLDGHVVLTETRTGLSADPVALGRAAARALLDDHGGASLLVR